MLVAWAAKIAARERGPNAATATDIIRSLGLVPAELASLDEDDEDEEDEVSPNTPFHQ